MMIEISSGVFRLNTPHTTYMFRVADSGHLEHLYFGNALGAVGDLEAYLSCSDLRLPTVVNDSDAFPRLYPTLLPLEFSSFGKGDLRECAFRGELGENGNTVFDFRYEGYSLERETDAWSPELPHARKNGAETLSVCLLDRPTGVRIRLLYTVYPDSDVILRQSLVENGSGETLTVRALASLQLDLEDAGFEALSFDGAWIRERQVHRTPLTGGTFSVQSTAGVSSAEHNPLFLLESGQECYLTNLLWSGDHREAAEVSPYGMLRLVTGLNPDSFSFRLKVGDRFASPEAVLLYSTGGENAASQQMHDFICRYISPPFWAERDRPILLNSWEGMGFDLSEENLSRQADAACKLGIELFVIDDGWFRSGMCARGDMGTWEPDPKKFPHGLRPVTEHIHSLGMLAGIWIEPEMISPDTALFREHPELMVRCPGREPSPGRDQYLLDMTQKKAVDIIYEKLERLIGENGFDYVKWDMNRYLADDWSPDMYIPEFRYRWTLGYYRLLQRLTARFPKVLIEGCSSGGSRFDLGALCYENQIWGSDNTDATSRVSIFSGTSYGYPPCCFGAHVSRIPNGITGRVYDYETAFHVNAFGAFGYELDVTKLSDEEKEMFRRQIEFYKTYRSIFQRGRFTRVREDNTVIWTAASEDGKTVLALYLEKRAPLSRASVRRLRVPDCRTDRLYRITARQQRVSDPAMTERRGGGHLSEEFSLTAPGALLQGRGTAIMPVFQGTDYKEHTAYFGDYSSRMFIIEEL